MTSLKAKAGAKKFRGKTKASPGYTLDQRKIKGPVIPGDTSALDKAVGRAEYEQQMIRLNKAIQTLKQQNPGSPKRNK